MNGWCNREHIFGIVVCVQEGVADPASYKERPLPQTIYAKVKDLLATGQKGDEHEADRLSRATSCVSRGSLAFG